MTKTELKPLRIEDYSVAKYKDSGDRCFGCCQENCGYDQCNCSCHREVTMYRIMKGQKVVSSGFKSKPDLASWIEGNLNLDRIEAMAASSIEREQNIFNRKVADIKKNFQRQIDRIIDVRNS